MSEPEAPSDVVCKVCGKLEPHHDTTAHVLRPQLNEANKLIDMFRTWVAAGCWASGIPEVRDAVIEFDKKR